jgi:hypothetical protein
MMTIQRVEPENRRDRLPELRSRTGTDSTAGPTTPTRRRSRSRNSRRPPSGLAPVDYALGGCTDCDAADCAADRQVLMYRPYRMSQRARLAITITVVVAAVVIGLNTALGSGTGGIGSVTVSAGESLWSIAQRLAPDADVWSVIDQITELNGLWSPVVHPGQTLVVPLP